MVCCAPARRDVYKRQAITEEMGFELISVPLSPDGPDLDMIAEPVANDDTIKGIW